MTDIVMPVFTLIYGLALVYFIVSFFVTVPPFRRRLDAAKVGLPALAVGAFILYPFVLDNYARHAERSELRSSQLDSRAKAFEETEARERARAAEQAAARERAAEETADRTRARIRARAVARAKAAEEAETRAGVVEDAAARAGAVEEAEVSERDRIKSSQNADLAIYLARIHAVKCGRNISDSKIQIYLDGKGWRQGDRSLPMEEKLFTAEIFFAVPTDEYNCTTRFNELYGPTGLNILAD